MTVPENGTAYSIKVLAYLAAHAIDPAVAQAVGVTGANGAIHYPYIDDAGLFERVRALGAGAKTRQPKGRALCCWWPAGRPDAPVATALIAEGESDALAALTAISRASHPVAQEILGGLAVVAVPGASFPVDRLAGELRGAELVILAPDGDRAGNSFAERAAGALSAAAIPSTRLPLPVGHDLADELAAAGDAGADWLAGVVADLEAAKVEGKQTGGEAVGEAVGLTDLSYSEAIAEERGETLRFVRGRGWLAWDGRRWVPGDDVAREAAKGIARARARDAAEGGDERAAKVALARCDEPRIRGSLELAQTDPALAVRAEALDAQPLLLCAQNGVVNLRTGAVADHDPTLLMTSLAGAEYHDAARSERWERFLECATGGDAQLGAYLQRAAGYSATGEIAEEIALFLHGQGGTGKTTLIEALRAALGDYAKTADFSTFLASRSGGDGPTPAVARLAGARMVCASEVSAGQRFNPARLKSLTGGERITAREMYGSPFEFTPAFTLWFAANDKPSISAADDGAWRRLRLIPFTNAVPAEVRDPELKRALVNDADERAAILAWIVKGAIAWHAEGLGTCTAVEQATAGYRADNDPIAHWLATCCQLHPDAQTYGRELYEGYQSYCRQSAEEPCSPQTFARELETHRLTRKRTNRGALWTGICIRPGGATVTDVTDQNGQSRTPARAATFPERSVTPVTPTGSTHAGDGLVTGSDGSSVTAKSASQSQSEGAVTEVTDQDGHSRTPARASEEFPDQSVTSVTPPQNPHHRANLRVTDDPSPPVTAPSPTAGTAA